MGLDRPAADLDRRVETRVTQMFRAGLVDEVRALESQGIRDGLTSSRALGYQQVLAMLDGRLTEADARAETALATKRFVRRQRSWFGRDPRVTWLDPGDDAVARALALLDP